MSEKKGIFFDIDDTLRRKSDGYLPPEIPDVLRQLKNNGHLVFIISGRSKSIFPKDILELEKEGLFAAVSSSNGQLAEAGKEIIHSNPLPQEDVNKIIQICKENNWDYLTHSYGKLCASRLNYRTMTANFGIEPWFVNPNHYLEEELYQICLYTTEEENKIFDELLAKTNPTEKYHTVPWFKFGCDVIPESGSKLRSLLKICEFFNLDIKNCFAFGDTFNDISMIKAAGVGVAMGNGSEELKKVADFVADRLDNQGVEKALKNFGLI